MIPLPHRGASRVASVVVAIVMTWCACAPAFGATASGARYLGSASQLGLKQPIVGMAATPSGKGYWLVAADGGIFSFGNAHFYGSTGSIRLNRPIVGMRAAPFGRGYWLVASDGGIFTFGNARFHGSTGGRALNQPIVGMAATPGGKGYWLVAADGGTFTFGTARYRGSATWRADPAPVVGIATTPSGLGYWIASAGGGTMAFGDARPFGMQMSPAQGAVVAIAASPRNGYWLATRDGTVGTSVGPSRTATIAFELLRRMNDERAARHLHPLGWDSLLAGYANSWAYTLLVSKPFRHQDLGAIIEGANGRLEQVGENLFAGDGTSADAGTAHLALMGSAEHRENMLLPQGQLVGIGVVCSGIKLIVVEDFGINMGAPLPPPNQAQAPAKPIVSTNPAGAHC
jgi:uncharacterized protein YkwD